jgi:siroheme synthase
MTQDTTLPGFVYLVGAGPGDPNYITLRAAKCLEQADVVLYDFLANPLILQHVRSDRDEFVLVATELANSGRNRKSTTNWCG